MTYTLDAPKNKPVPIKIKSKDSPFQKSKNIQMGYERALRGVAKEVGKLIRGYDPKDLLSVERLKRALYSYSDLIEPWARKLAGKVVVSLDYQDKNAWRKHTQKMSVAMRLELLNTPTGDELRQLLEDNVALITSLPIEAAQRVHELVTESLATSIRASEIATKIMKTEDITKNRATMIARTEVARASSLLTQVRATNIGSDSYIWRTANDRIVRESHRKMNGRQVKWAVAPTLIDGTTTHAGQIYNCRCYPEPIISDLE